MTPTKNREIHLKSRPTGEMTPDAFGLLEVEMPEVVDNQLLVKTIYMSVDPYMRGRMFDRDSYVEPFELNKPLQAHSVGKVVESKHPDFAAGDYVWGLLNWSEYNISNGEGLTKVNPELAPLQTYLGVLGVTGFTAYVAMTFVTPPEEGQTIFVSNAAGAVGSMVCQIAKLKGCTVVGSAGSDQKVEWLVKEAGVDRAFNYKKTDDLTTEVAKQCPQGVDIYFENVGAEHLEAALENMNNFGRVALCGMMAVVNAPEPPAAPRNLDVCHRKRLTLQGFNVVDHLEKMPRFFGDMAKWIGEGKIKWQDTIVQGLEKAPEALIGLFKGANFGKMIVQVGTDD